MNELTNISPVDGRYAGKTRELQNYFSEFALIRYRVFVELKYFVALSRIPIPGLSDFNHDHEKTIQTWLDDFDKSDAESIKQTEKITNHDVKAVEYWIKDQFDKEGWQHWKEFIHFGLTSQDINNTSIPLMLRDCLHQVILPEITEVLELLNQKSEV